MSLPDHLLEPDDDVELCEDHGKPWPCHKCRAEAEAEWAEARWKDEVFQDILHNRRKL